MSDTYNITQYLDSGEKDSDGNYLPPGFYSAAMTKVFAWTIDGFPQTKTETVVIGLATYTRVTTYSNDGTNITEEIPTLWVKS